MNFYELVVDALCKNEEQTLYKQLKKELQEEVSKDMINYRKVQNIAEVLEKLEVLL